MPSDLGVLADLPTIGVGKTMMAVDGLLSRWQKRRLAAGTQELLVGNSGRVWGAAVRVPCSSDLNDWLTGVEWSGVEWIRWLDWIGWCNGRLICWFDSGLTY